MRLKSLLVTCVMTLFAAGCTPLPKTQIAQVGYISTKKLQQIEEASKINKVRLAAIRTTAASLGARGALAWRATHIDAALKAEGGYLDHVYDFNQILIRDNVLPPVLTSADNTLNLANDAAIRLADRTYRIVSPARFVTAPPTWRTYLWLGYKKPEVPDFSLLPRNNPEVIVWNEYLVRGWKQGLAQANEIFSSNLSRLTRDYLGMVMYRKLLAQKMISQPYVASASLGVTGNANELRIDDQIMRITQRSKLNPDSKAWNAVITKH